jgi:hypothetical protein
MNCVVYLTKAYEKVGELIIGVRLTTECLPNKEKNDRWMLM